MWKLRKSKQEWTLHQTWVLVMNNCFSSSVSPKYNLNFLEPLDNKSPIRKQRAGWGEQGWQMSSHPKGTFTEALLLPCSQLHSSQQKQTIKSLIQLLSSKLLTNMTLIWRHVESGKHMWRTGHNRQHLSLLRNGNASSCSSPACLSLECTHAEFNG